MVVGEYLHIALFGVHSLFQHSSCSNKSESHNRRMRGCNKKLLEAARTNISKEAIEAERTRQERLQKSPDDIY